MAPNAPPPCAAIASQLITPCTAGFRAMRGDGSPMLYLQPLVAVNVAASPGCNVSRCQGGVATLTSSGNGTGALRQGMAGVGGRAQPLAPRAVQQPALSGPHAHE